MDLRIRDMCQKHVVTLAAMIKRIDGLGFVSGDRKIKQSQNGYDESQSSSRNTGKIL
jgi:hypothetical protein